MKKILVALPEGVVEILDKEIKTIIFAIGIVTDLLLFAVFCFLLKTKMPIEEIRTIIFAGLAVDSLLYVFSCKTLRKNLWHEEIFSNRFLVFSVIFGFILLFVGIYSPLSGVLKTQALNSFDWLLIFSLGLVNVLAIEGVKWVFLREKRSQK